MASPMASRAEEQGLILIQQGATMTITTKTTGRRTKA